MFIMHTGEASTVGQIGQAAISIKELLLQQVISDHSSILLIMIIPIIFFMEVEMQANFSGGQQLKQPLQVIIIIPQASLQVQQS